MFKKIGIEFSLVKMIGLGDFIGHKKIESMTPGLKGKKEVLILI
jgi:hypothetical protein